MLTNIVSPASLYSSEPSNPGGNMMLGLHSNASQESQHSQNSLFSSDVPNSMELFSQPNSSQSQSQTTAAFLREHHGGNGTCVQEEGRGRSAATTHTNSQQPLSNTLNGGSQSSQMSCGKKYYMKYLTQFPMGGRREKADGGNKTPLRADGDTVFSRTSFDAWKVRQQEKLENKKIIDGVIQCTKDITKELNDKMESLRAEIRNATTPVTAGRQQESSMLSDQQTRSIFAQLLQGQMEMKQQLLQGQVEMKKQLLQGQVEMKQQLADLQRQCTQHREGVDSLCAHISDTHCPNKLPTSVESSLMECIRGCISEAVKESFRNYTSKLEEVIASSGRGVREVGVTGCAHVEKCYRKESLNGDGALMPIDQAVPSMNDDLCAGDSSREGEIAGGGRRTRASAGAPDAPLLSHKQQVKSSSMNTDQQKLNSSANTVLDPDLSHPTTHFQHTCTQGDLTSQSSVAYDIDLTQQSPSVCSQIISQHLEQHHGSGTQKRKRKQEYSAATRESPGDPTLVGTPLGGLKRRKLPAQDRGRGRRKRGGSRTVAVNQSPYIKRRSQRIRKRTPLVQHVDSGESEPTQTPSGGAGSIHRKAPLRGRPPSSSIHTPLGGMPTVSPLNALNDSLYSQDTASHLPAGNSGTTPLSGVQPLPAHAPLSAGKFQRSSEAARRRIRIIAGMSSSGAALKEISESLRSQIDAEPSP